MLTKEAILGADDLHRERVEVPEWGGEVYVRGLMGHELIPFEKVITDFRDKKPGITSSDVKTSLLVLCLCNEAGEPLFTQDDAPALSRKHGGAITRLWNVALRLNGLGDETEQELLGN